MTQYLSKQKYSHKVYYCYRVKIHNMFIRSLTKYNANKQTNVSANLSIKRILFHSSGMQIYNNPNKKKVNEKKCTDKHLKKKNTNRAKWKEEKKNQRNKTFWKL